MRKTRKIRKIQKETKGLSFAEVEKVLQKGRDEAELSAEKRLQFIDKSVTAMDKAGKGPEDIDAVITACSNLERAYPAVSIEVQQILGIGGFAFDMNVACSSATFGIQAAADMIKSGSAQTILIVDPEVTTGHLDFKDRDCHFIFGDVCTAILLEKKENAKSNNAFEILSTKTLPNSLFFEALTLPPSLLDSIW